MLYRRNDRFCFPCLLFKLIFSSTVLSNKHVCVRKTLQGANNSI